MQNQLPPSSSSYMMVFRSVVTSNLLNILLFHRLQKSEFFLGLSTLPASNSLTEQGMEERKGRLMKKHNNQGMLQEGGEKFADRESLAHCLFCCSFSPSPLPATEQDQKSKDHKNANVSDLI